MSNNQKSKPPVERSLKVQYKYKPHSYDRVPEILLKGVWLQQLGFSIGEKVIVVCQENVLVIKKAVEKS